MRRRALFLVPVLAVLLVAGCDQTSTSDWTVRPPQPSQDDVTPEPSDPPAGLTGDCSDTALRAARGGDGESLLESEETYDAFVVHGCAGQWALVESNPSSASTFMFWLMWYDADGWNIIDVAGTRNDTPLSEGLFSAADLTSAGYSTDEIVAALGSTTRAGRPLFS
ncbi:MAG: hypothetical protein FWD11_07570 [Micrococcales bacterium]|nr:hypothetical protein [Micrococcales bacterium]